MNTSDQIHVVTKACGLEKNMEMILNSNRAIFMYTCPALDLPWLEKDKISRSEMEQYKEHVLIGWKQFCMNSE